MSNVQAQAGQAADELTLILVDLRGLCADGRIDAAEFPRLTAICESLPGLVNRLDWIGGSIDLAVQILRRGPDLAVPDRKLARRLADLATVRQDDAPALYEAALGRI